MWDKINKIQVQVIIACISVCASFGLLFLLVFKEVPARNEKLVDILIGAVIGSTLTAVIGWLYTTNKREHPTNNNKPAQQ